jgi:hypothetical protein
MVLRTEHNITFFGEETSDSVRELQHTALIEGPEVQRGERRRNAVYESRDPTSVVIHGGQAVEVQPIPYDEYHEHCCSTQSREEHGASYLNINVRHTYVVIFLA